MPSSTGYGASVAPRVPGPTPRLPALLLWFVPFLLVIVYVLVVNQFFHAQAHWTGDRLIGVTVLLLGVTAIFSVIWFGVALGASLLFGEYVAYGILRLISKIPGLHRHVVITPPARPDDGVQQVLKPEPGRPGIAKGGESPARA